MLYKTKFTGFVGLRILNPSAIKQQKKLRFHDMQKQKKVNNLHHKVYKKSTKISKHKFYHPSIPF